MNKSFTLIEVLVVIVVIGVLSAFILVGMSSITSNANVAKNKVYVNSMRNSLLINLIAEWNLDGNVNDPWKGHNGTLVDAPVPKTESDCAIDGCYWLDGSNDYINLGNSTDFSFGTGNFTISYWSKQDSSTPKPIMCDGNHGDANNSWYIEQMNGIMVTRFYYGGIDQNDGSWFSVPGITMNKWHYYIVTRNVGELKLKVYLNGVLVKEFTSINVINITDANDLYLGYDARGMGSFNGYIDDVKIFNEAFSISQAQQNYFAGINKLFKNNGITLNEFNQRIVELKTNLANNE
jgi:prepilin-type N-terminal cleavage/methylation domain-containing protein